MQLSNGIAMNKDGVHYTSIWPHENGRQVQIIDQTRLPHDFVIVDITSLQAMITAIKTMQVRGAPLIGAAAAYGMALAMLEHGSTSGSREPAQGDQAGSDAWLDHCAALLLASRPTAVNLRWAVQRMQAVLQPLPAAQRVLAAWQEAATICSEDIAINRAIAGHGLQLIEKLAARRLAAGSTVSQQQPLQILTHCNAGWLATVDWGTALAPIYAAHDGGIAVHVWVDETRPRNQGASLSAWELGQHGVPHTVITDNAGGHLMQHGQVDMVIVGADRVTRSGDVCNKIGTYLKALAACDNAIPFYVAVPSPTIDWQISDGLQEIPIEERDGDEVRRMSGREVVHGQLTAQTACIELLPADSPVANPAFDVTPARLVTGIITERGVYPPDKLEVLLT